MKDDQEHLRLLVIFHYVLAGVAAFFACMPLVHVAVGLFFILNPESMHDAKGQGPPAFFGWFFFGIGAFLFVAGMLFASLVFATGRFLARRKHHLFCMVAAGFECLFMPFGTVLGVFTLLVLNRESVKALFNGAAANLPPP